MYQVSCIYSKYLQENYFRIRSELNNKPTLNISGEDTSQFQDKLGKAKVSFKKFLITSIKYS